MRVQSGRRAAGAEEWIEMSASSYLFVNDLFVPKMRQGAIRQGKSKLIIRIRKSRPNENKENRTKIHSQRLNTIRVVGADATRTSTQFRFLFAIETLPNSLSRSASPLVQLFYVFGW